MFHQKGKRMSNRYTKTTMLLGAVLFSPGPVVALPVASHATQIETARAFAAHQATAPELQGLTAGHTPRIARRSSKD